MGGGGATNWLDWWTFSDTVNWTDVWGDAPLGFTNVAVSLSGNGTSLQIDTNLDAWMQYNTVQTPMSGPAATNLTMNGTWLFFFAPDWTSANTNSGSGPGVPGRLIEIGSSNAAANYGWLSLYVDSQGNHIYLSAQTNSGVTTNYLSAPISWVASNWHYLAVTLTPTNSALYIDSSNAASGPGLTILPPPNVYTNGFYVLSDSTGALQAHGAIDDLITYSNALTTNDLSQIFQGLEPYYVLNPLNQAGGFSAPPPPGPGLSLPPITYTYPAGFEVIDGPGSLIAIRTNTSLCYGTNVWDVWLSDVSAAAVDTNVVPVLDSSGDVLFETNPVVTINFTITGGTPNTPYDVFATTSITLPYSDVVWAWSGQGNSGVTYQLPGLVSSATYLILGTPYDPENDGLTEAYERLVSHSNPLNPNFLSPNMNNGWAVLWAKNPFAIYDQAAFPNAPWPA
jgi:hypothetical protein